MPTDLSPGASLLPLLLNLMEQKTFSDAVALMERIQQRIENSNNPKEFSAALWACEEKLLDDLHKAFFVRPIQFCLPPLFSRCGIKSKYPTHWVEIAHRLTKLSTETKGVAKLEMIAAVATHQAMAQQPDRALFFHLILLLDTNLSGVLTQNLIELSLRLSLIGWFRVNDIEFRTDLINLISLHGPRQGRRELWVIVAIFLGVNEKFSHYNNAVTPEFLGFLFHNLILPLMDSLIENNQADHVLLLEGKVYDSYMRTKDTAEHYFHIKSQIVPRLLSYARRLRDKLSPIHKLPSMQKKQKVVFFVFNTANLAHSRVLLNYLRGQISLTDSQIQPIVACFYFIESDFSKAVQTLGVELFIPKSKGFAAILETRQWCSEQGVTAFIYVSTSAAMPMYLGIGMAPVQIYWSLKYHCEIFDEIHGYMASGAFQRYRRIGSRDWRAGHCAIQNLFSPTETAPAQATRAALSEQGKYLLLGSFGREVKYNNDNFVAALAKILGKLPEALYLWTGRVEAPEIVERFERFGIANRCRFIGWVNTAHYAQVIDLYVDTFPFASGHTAMEAMAAGCPVVLLATQEALDSSIATHVLPAYRGHEGTPEQQQRIRAIFTDVDGSSLLPMVDSVEEYISWAVTLARDPGLRARAGTAAQRFVQETLGDVQQMARDYNQHILEIIDERRQCG